MFLIAGLYLLAGGAHAQGFWKSASPLDLLAGQGSVSVIGFGLSPGVTDYVCSFRTNIVNPFRGEFEARTSVLRVMSPTDATCPAPAWDLPATTVVLEIYKADVLLTKQGPTVEIKMLPAVSGIAPATGPASGLQSVNISGVAFDARLGSNQAYYCIFTGTGGRSKRSDPCSAISTTVLSCPVPPWTYPAIEAVVTVFNQERQIERVSGSPILLYEYLPSCDFYSSLSAYALEPKTITISGFGLAPLPDASCIFRYNDTTDIATAVQSEDSGDSVSYRCSTPVWELGACVSAQTCTNNVSLYVYQGNSTQICASAERKFAFLSTWTAVEGSTGKATGGHMVTVRGGGFDRENNYVCRFTCPNAAFVSESVIPLDQTTLVCTVPAINSLPCVANIEVIQGSELIHALSGPALYTYRPVWLSTNRKSVPRTGEASMAVYGMFSPNLEYRCAFASLQDDVLSSHMYSDAFLFSNSRLSCAIPSWNIAGDARFSVVLSDGTELERQPSDDYIIAFTDESWSSFEPMSSLVVVPMQSMQIYLFGSFSANASDYSCKVATAFSNRVGTISRTSVTSTSMVCVLEQWHPDAAGSARIYVFRGGAEVPSSREPLSFRLDAVWTGLSASSGSGSGGTMLTVYGNGFTNIANYYTCRFCMQDCVEMRSSAATFVSSSELLCATPSWTYAAATTKVELDNREGNIQYGCNADQVCTTASFGDSFQYLASWTDFNPKIVPCSGGLAVTVSGYGFDSSRWCACRFSSAGVVSSVNATIVSSLQLICDAHTCLVTDPLEAHLAIDCDGVVALNESNATLLHTVNSVDSGIPSSASAGGGTMVTLRGTNFCKTQGCSGSTVAYRCTFVSYDMGWNSSGVPIAVTSDTVECVSPSWPFVAPARVSVSLFDVQLDRAVWAKTAPTLELYETVIGASVAACAACSCNSANSTVANGTVAANTAAPTPAALPCLAASKSHTITVSGHGFDENAKDYSCIIQLSDTQGSILTLQSPATMPASSQQLVCHVPMLPLGTEARERTLLVYRGGQSIFGSVQVEYYPEWSTLFPSTGSAHGCTTFDTPCPPDSMYIFLKAYGLIRSRKYFCNFRDAQYQQSGTPVLAVSGTEAQCALPVWSKTASSVEVSLLDESSRIVEHLSQYSNSFLFDAIVTDYSPKAFLSNASTAIAVSGYGFGAGSVHAYQCRVISSQDNSVLMTGIGTPVSDRQISCRVPPVSLMSQQADLRIVNVGPPESDVAFAVNLRHDNLDIQIFWSRLSPNEALASGGDVITVIGGGFESGSASYVCKFSHPSLGSVQVTGLAISSTAIECTAPRWLLQESSMLFELFDVATKVAPPGNTDFFFRAMWSFASMVPQWSPVDGGVDITLTGYGFDPSRQYRMLISTTNGNVTSNVLVPLDYNTIIFAAPSIATIPDEEQNVTGLVLERQDASTNEPDQVHRKNTPVLQYLSYVDRVWSMWSGVLGNGEAFDYQNAAAMRAPTGGGTSIYLSGDGFIFGGGTDYKCRFTSSEGFVESTAAAAVNRTLVMCSVPAWTHPILPGDAPQVTLLRTSYFPLQSQMRQRANIEFVPIVESVRESSAPNTNNTVIILGKGFDRFILYYCTFEQTSGVFPYFSVEHRSVGGWPISETEIQCDSVDWGSDYRSRSIIVVLEDETGAILHAGFNILTMPLEVVMIPLLVAVVPAEAYVMAQPLVTVFAHGLDGTLSSTSRELSDSVTSTLQHLDPDLSIDQSAGMLFNIQTTHAVILDAIDLKTRKLASNVKCAVFYRNGSFEGFERDMSAWQPVASSLSDSDSASSTRTTLHVPLHLPAQFTTAFLVLVSDGVRYAEPQYDGVQDYFIAVQGGGVVVANWNSSHNYSISNVIRRSGQVTPFVGKILYRNKAIMGRRYKCKFEDEFSHMVESNWSYAFLTNSQPEIFVTNSFSCKMPRWPYGEALTKLSIQDDAGIVLENGAFMENTFFTYSRWENLSTTVARALGGSVVDVTGHGFDVSLLSNYTCAFENAQLGSATCAGLVQSTTVMQCLSPPWNFAAKKNSIYSAEKWCQDTFYCDGTIVRIH